MTLSTRERIFISAAAGRTGQSILKALSEPPQGNDIVAGVYSEQAAQQQSMVEKYGVAAVPVDGLKPDSIELALHDVTTLVLIPIGREKRITIAKNYIEAARRNPSVHRVILISVNGAGEGRGHVARQFYEIEQELENSSFSSWTIIRASYYAENLLSYAEDIRSGVLRLPTGSGKFSPISVEDVGTMVRHVLLSDDVTMHNRQHYEASGHSAWNGEQIAALAGRTLKKSIKFDNVSSDWTSERLAKQGMHPETIRALVEFYELVRHSRFNNSNSRDFERVCGRKPKTMSEFFSEHRDQLR